MKIQPKVTDLSKRLWGITTEFVGFIPQSLMLRSMYRNCSIALHPRVLINLGRRQLIPILSAKGTSPKEVWGHAPPENFEMERL